jgi:hypothetical protein
MTLDFFDHSLTPALPQQLTELQFDYGLCHRAHSDKYDRDTYYDQERVEDSATQTERMHFTVTQGRHGSQSHVERIEDRPAFDQGKTRSSNHQHQDDGAENIEKPPLEAAEAILVGKLPGNRFVDARVDGFPDRLLV